MFEGLKNWWYGRQRAKQLAAAPTTLDEAVARLESNSSPEDLAKFKAERGGHPGSSCHFGSGMAMRNGWGLWEKDQPLTKWFRANDIWHADDMSAIIFKALWFKLNAKKFDIKKEAKYYTKYWKSQGLGFDGKELPNYNSVVENKVLVVRRPKKRKKTK